MKSKIFLLILLCCTFFYAFDVYAYDCFLVFHTPDGPGTRTYEKDFISDLGIDSYGHFNPVINTFPAYTEFYSSYYTMYLYAWNGSSWVLTQSEPFDTSFEGSMYESLMAGELVSSDGKTVGFHPDSADRANINILYPNGCSDLPSSCPDIDTQAATACGGAGNVSSIDTELCTYSCVPCSDLASECVTQCDPFNVNAFDCTESTDGSGNITSLTINTPCGCFEGNCEKYESDCSAQCGGFYDFTCDDDSQGYVESYDCNCDVCSLERSQFAESNCGGLKYLAWYDCNSHSGECKYRSCNDALQDCSDKCGGLISVYSCDESSGTAIDTCFCDGDLDQTNDGLPDNTGDPATDPDPTNNGEQDPEAGDTDSTLLSKLVTNTKATSENTKALHHLTDRELNELNKNTVDTNNQLKLTNKNLDDIEDKLDDLKPDLSGTYTKETITNDYTLGDDANEVSQFTSRFDTFITDLKATPLFSLPNQVLFNIPNSEVSSIPIDMGQYGQAEIDLADYANGLLILRSAFLLCFCFAGLRIVVSKK